jgi:signal transduction histidine kinase
VADTGPGLSDNDIEHLFDPFNRLGHESIGGTGLGVGLTICQRLASLIGARIEVESVEGKGSTFCLELPMNDSSLSNKNKVQ